MELDIAGHIKVFGSSTIRVLPDRAVIDLGVRSQHAEPAGAFAAANTSSAGVLSFLNTFGIVDVRSSRISLTQAVEDARERPRRREP